jgi:ketosteroid isomerase-like protein
VRESFLITVLVASSLFAGTSASDRKIDNNAIISERDAKVRADNKQKEEAMAEAEIRKRAEDWAKAIHAKDIDAVMFF